MPKFTLTDGAFGQGPAAADLAAFHLPDPARRGGVLLVPLREVAEMAMIGSDNADRIKNAIRSGAVGLLSLGPVGVAAGMRAAGKAPSTLFTVRLEDGRRFTARAAAADFAEIHAAQVEARAIAGSHPADAVIAKYLADAPPAPRRVPPLPPEVPAEPKPRRSPQAPPRPSSPVPFGRRGL